MTDSSNDEISQLMLIERYISYGICSLSVLGSAMIMSSVFRSKKNRENVQQLVLGYMSICDFILAFLRLTGNLWLPSRAGPRHYGNEVLCDITGFLNITVFTGTVGYNGALALYYLLVIRYNWKQIRLEKIFKPYILLAPIINGIFWAALAVIWPDVVTISNGSKALGYCSVGVDPERQGDPDYEFTENVVGALWKSFPVMYSSIIVFNIICIIIVYQYVKKVDMNAARISMRNLKRRKVVATQFKLFAAAFLVPGVLYVITISMLSNGVPIPEWCIAVTTSILFTAGIFNSIVYFRMRYNRLLVMDPNGSRIKFVLKIIQDNLFPCSCCGNKQNQRASTGDCEPELEITERNPTERDDSKRSAPYRSDGEDIERAEEQKGDTECPDEQNEDFECPDEQNDDTSIES